MNKLIERIVYTLFGALLVSVAHFVGSIDHRADAQHTTFRAVTITGHLIVEGGIVVGDPSAPHDNSVLITAGTKSASIVLAHGESQVVFITTNTERPSIELIHNRSKNGTDANVLLTAHTTEDNEPNAGIMLQDKLGNTTLISSDLGLHRETR